jgi:hypothetical protein
MGPKRGATLSDAAARAGASSASLSRAIRRSHLVPDKLTRSGRCRISERCLQRGTG